MLKTVVSWLAALVIALCIAGATGYFLTLPQPPLQNSPSARWLSSHGYIVVAANFPLTYRYAPGGPTVTDLANQPADVSFLIDAVLELEDPP